MTISTDLPSSALQLLRRLDIHVAAGGPTHWQLVLPDGRPHSVEAKVRRQPPPPSWVDSQNRHGTPLLIVTTRITEFLRTSAQQCLLDVIDVHNDVAIIAGTTFTLGQTDNQPKPLTSSARGRKPWVRWATERLLLLTDEPMTQAGMAAALSVTQQSVSLALRAHRYARRTVDGWRVQDKSAQLQEHLLEYPGPGGASTYWFELESPVQQAEHTGKFAAQLRVPALHSGDVAADAYAPWRMPRTATVYTSEILNFTSAGFTPASLHDYTLKVTVPVDATMWKTAAVTSTTRTHLTLADPVIALHDLLLSPGTDAIEAAARLRDAIVEGTWRG